MIAPYDSFSILIELRLNYHQNASGENKQFHSVTANILDEK